MPFGKSNLPESLDISDLLFNPTNLTQFGKVLTILLGLLPSQIIYYAFFILVPSQKFCFVFPDKMRRCRTSRILLEEASNCSSQIPFSSFIFCFIKSRLSFYIYTFSKVIHKGLFLHITS